MHQPDFTKEQLEELAAWAKDPRGEPFWLTLRQLFSSGVSRMRKHAREGNAVQNAFQASHVDTLEEVLDLPRMIIEDHAEEARKEEKGAKGI